MRIMLSILLVCSWSVCAYAQEIGAQVSTQESAQEKPKQSNAVEKTAEEISKEKDQAVGSNQPSTQKETVSVQKMPTKKESPVQPQQANQKSEQESAPIESATGEKQVPAEAQTNQPTSVPEQAAEQPVEQAQVPRQESEQQVQTFEQPQEPQPETEEPPIKVEEIEGIDTVDLKEPRGNWLFKRIWWERAEKKYEKIRTLVQEILESRMKFFMERSEIDKNVLDPFYIEVGLNKGEFQEVLDELTKKLEQVREKDVTLTGPERDLLNTLENEKDTLDQLTLDVQSIGQLDRDIDNALSKLMEQINRVRRYERDAWRYFKEISRVLSDTKARELFYKMEVIANNIKDIKEYIDQTFNQYFENIVATTKESVQRIETNVQSFEEKGINFKKQAQKMIEQVMPAEKTESDEEEEEEEEEESSQGWFGATMSMIGGAAQSTFHAIKYVITTIWDYTVYLIKMPYNLIFGPKEIVENESDEEEQNIQTEKSDQKQIPQENSTIISSATTKCYRKNAG